jgi:hypothetical protein
MLQKKTLIQFLWYEVRYIQLSSISLQLNHQIIRNKFH